MNAPKVTRPTFPKGYVDHPTSELAWEEVETQLKTSMHYWLCTIRPNGRPHVIPRWGVFLDGKFYYDGSSETRHARNLAQNPHASLHLESGLEAVIMEGESAPAGKPGHPLALRISEAYCAKYKDKGYSPEPDQWDEGGLYVFTPHTCLAWTVFNENPTKFIFG